MSTCNDEKLITCPFAKFEDCKMRVEGIYCDALEDANFHGKDCPFYKSKYPLDNESLKKGEAYGR